MDLPDYTDPAELLTVVDGEDNPIGAERRDVIHRDGLLHRAIHLFVFRRTGELLLQQRSAKKDMYPLHWECVGGHVAPGDDYVATAIREAEEELGLRVEMDGLEFLGKVGASERTDQEFICVYRTVTSGVPRPNVEEVIGLEWMRPEQWREEIRGKRRRFSPVLLTTLESCALIQ